MADADNLVVTRFCEDCRHKGRKRETTRDDYLCTCKVTSVDPINGTKYYEWASVERTKEDRCGPEGKWYEPEPPVPPPEPPKPPKHVPSWLRMLGVRDAEWVYTVTYLVVAIGAMLTVATVVVVLIVQGVR